MDLFQAFRNQVQNHLSIQKSKKIYVFNKRKSNNINQKKLNELVQMSPNTPKKQKQSSLQGSIRKYLNEQYKQSRHFSNNYRQQQKESSIQKKNKEIRSKITSNFHISSFKNKQTSEKPRRKDIKSSEDKLQAISHTQLKVQKSCNNYPKNKQNQVTDLEYLIQLKKNSLPHLSKRSISFSDQCGNSPLKPKQYSRSPLGDYSPGQDCEFLKTGIINGYKIKKSSTKQKLIQKHETVNSQKIDQFTSNYLNLQNSHSQPQKLSDQYYSLIRKTDYKKMTNNAGTKVIRNNFLELKKKRSRERQKLKITQLHGKSLVKLQEILSLQNKQDLKM